MQLTKRQLRSLAASLTLLAGPAVLLTAATPALAAGSAVVEMCKTSDGAAIALTGWSANTNTANNCAAGGTFAVTLPGGGGLGATASSTLTAPPDVMIAAADLWRAYSAPVGSDRLQLQVSSSWENGGWPYRGVSSYGGYGGDAQDNPFPATLPLTLSGDRSSLTMGVSCVYFGGGAGSCTSGNYQIRKLDLTLSDENAPLITTDPNGPMLDRSWQTSALAHFSLGASDRGLGAYRAFIRDGANTYYAPLDPTSTTCKDLESDAGDAYQFNRLVPCDTTTRTYVPEFNLAGIGDGTHTVSVGIEDAAGNERIPPGFNAIALKINAPGGSLPDPRGACTTAGQAGTYGSDGVCTATASGGGGGGPGGGQGGVTPNPTGGGSTTAPALAAVGAPSVPALAQIASVANGRGASRHARVTVSWGQTGRTVVAAHYTSHSRLTGRVLDEQGQPIADARVAIMAARDVPGASVALLGTPSTDGEGRFSFAVGSGPSRRITAAYSAYSDDALPASTAQARIAVRAGVSLHIAPRHLAPSGRISMRGGLRYVAQKGVEIKIQALDGHRWRTFDTVHTDQHGKFRFGYRFRGGGGRVFYFRAVANSPVYPFTPGASRTVRVSIHR